MRRLITSLAILGVVLVAGMTTLVLLVDPNDFRSYMMTQVARRSGYQLEIDGGLRWHVWPQLSILTGRMTLTAPGAVQPMVTAGNMRLDVRLLPLLSHQLVVKEVMLKDAVLHLTPASQKQRPIDEPVAPAGQQHHLAGIEGWSFDIARLRVSNGLVIWQRPDGREYNLRALDLTLVQENRQRLDFQFSSQINRNQQSLQLSLSGNVDISHYPYRLGTTLDDFSYRLSGVDLPQEDISGRGQLTGEWQAESQRLTLDNFSLTANDSQLGGQLSVTPGPRPEVNVTLHADNLNLDALLGVVHREPGSKSSDGLVRKGRPPVIAVQSRRSYRDSLLKDLTGNLEMTVDALRWRGMGFRQIALAGESQQGLITLSRFNGQYGDGNFSLPASVDLRGDTLRAEVHPVVSDLDMAPLLKGFDLPAALSGKLSAQGEFYGTDISPDAIIQQWQGQAQVSISEAGLGQLNLVRMIQQAAERSDSRIQASDHEMPGSMKQLTAQATLNSGVLLFDQLYSHGPAMKLGGRGEINLVERTSDLRFDITVTGNWRGHSQLIQRLQTTAIPLRIFGNWDQLSYSLHLDNILRKQLRDEARQRVERWLNQQKSRAQQTCSSPDCNQ